MKYLLLLILSLVSIGCTSATECSRSCPYGMKTFTDIDSRNELPNCVCMTRDDLCS